MDFTVEELSMNAWPSIQTVLLDGWVLRMANGYTKRANSVNPLYSFQDNLDKKIKYCENIYRKNDLPVVFKIIDCEEYKIIDRRLEQLNYKKIDLTSVQVCNSISLEYITDKINKNTEFNEEWKNCFYSCNGIEDIKIIDTIELMLKNIKGDIIAVYKKEKGSFIGCGYGVIEKGFIGIFDIIVKEEFRGKGYGKEIVQILLGKAKEIGIEKAYLQVVENNSIATRLYKELGFNEIYKYWYRKKE
jgi:GNAT superfamily N-acetyltransferase